MPLKKAIRTAELKAKLMPRFWEFWKDKTAKERREIYQGAMGEDIPAEMHKTENAHLFSLDEVAGIMEYWEL